MHGEDYRGCPRRGGVLFGAVMLFVGAVGCGEQHSSSGAPPLVVCGTTLHSGPAGAVEFQIWRHQPNVLPSAGGLYYIRVSRDCSHGSTVSITPTDAVSIAHQAKADDGLLAEVVLKARRAATVTVMARRGDAVVGSMRIKLQMSAQ